MLLAEHAEAGSDEELDLLRRGVEAGKKALGKAAFRDFAGYFWGFLETRPYMRARFGLAQALWSRGYRDEAIVHLRGMLNLNPNDNQGARYVLAAFLLEAGQDEALAKLLATYPEDGMAAWTWTAALAAFRRAGDDRQSRSLLAEALKSNAHVLPYLLGDRQLPKQMPPYISPGNEDEAIEYVSEFRKGWMLTPGAIDSLHEQMLDRKTARSRLRRAKA